MWVHDIAELEQARADVSQAGIPHYAWSEPSPSMVNRLFGGIAFTALATTPIEQEQRALFSQYERIRFDKFAGAVASNGGSHFNVDPGTNSPVVSNIKTPASNTGDASESLAGRTSLPCAGG